MSGLEVLGGITAVITIIKTSADIWDRVKEDIKLPETFRIVACRLPIVLYTLKTCHDTLETGINALPPEVISSVQDIVTNIEGQARMLNSIFEKTIPGEDANLLDRYYAAVSSVGNGKKVEDLLKTIADGMRVLVDLTMVQRGRPHLDTNLRTLEIELQNVAPSIVDGDIVTERVSSPRVASTRPGSQVKSTTTQANTYSEVESSLSVLRRCSNRPSASSGKFQMLTRPLKISS